MKSSISEFHSVQQLNSIIGLLKNELSLQDSTTLAMQLVIHGMTDLASEFIALKKRQYLNRHILVYLDYLSRINSNVSRYKEKNQFDVNSDFFKNLLSFKSAYVKNEGSDHLIVVFATAWNNFGVSFPVLHSILWKYPVSILYLKNRDKGMYCNGCPGMGGTIDEMAGWLAKFKSDEGYKKVSVLGFSSGGYASLYAAGAIAADSYIGFGVRTDWSEDCKIPRSSGRVAPLPEHYKTNTLVNLAGHKDMARISKARLYFGDKDGSDRAHATNMSTLSNFDLVPVSNSTHNVILHLMAEGRFEEVLCSGLAIARP